MFGLVFLWFISGFFRLFYKETKSRKVESRNVSYYITVSEKKRKKNEKGQPTMPHNSFQKEKKSNEKLEQHEHIDDRSSLQQQKQQAP